MRHVGESLAHVRQVRLAHATGKLVGVNSQYGNEKLERSQLEVTHEAPNRILASRTHNYAMAPEDESRQSESLSDKSQDYDEDFCKVPTDRTSEKRGKDVLRYLALCIDNPTAFRHAIESAPDSTIRRICDAVLNVTEGDAQAQLTAEQRRLCDKYKRSISFLISPKKSLKRKRLLLRSVNKQVGGSVFAPLMLKAALDTFGSALIPPKL
jgi:hypothetical protein